MSDAHLIYRGSGRFREDYEVQQRSTGRRLGCVNQHGRAWEAVADDGTHAFAPTRRDAALVLWPGKTRGKGRR